jgi:sugar/nucleoside kinase (ribokinase family)
MKPIIISGTGSALIDYVYTPLDFSRPSFQKYLSRQEGDGGLKPGGLVFTEEFHAFAGRPFDQVLDEITEAQEPAAVNIGGPAIVALINTAQLMHGRAAKVCFHGAMGRDAMGDEILKIVGKTPLDITHYKRFEAASPFTDVLSDPCHGGSGERLFVNNLGAANEYHPADLGEAFFDSRIILFGATALVPAVHRELAALLRKGKDRGCITMVTTVYDFPREKKDPHARWLLGPDDESLPFIDLLVMNQEEALRISGTTDVSVTLDFFSRRGVSAVVVTQGIDPVRCVSDGRLFRKTGPLSLPTSKAVAEDFSKDPGLQGDTTGCGDNFAGGVLYSLAAQLQDSPDRLPDLEEACAWGIASGAFACYYMGGTFLESRPGEKLERISSLYRRYLQKG